MFSAQFGFSVKETVIMKRSLLGLSEHRPFGDDTQSSGYGIHSSGYGSDCYGSDCFEAEVEYPAPMDRIVSLMNSLGNCSQKLSVECESAPLEVSI